MKKLTRKNVDGVWSAMPTPFTNELKLDLEVIPRLIEQHLMLGIKGIHLAGVSGEGLCMNNVMRINLAKEMAKHNQNRKLLSMLIADNPAKMMLDNIKRFQDCGIDIAVIAFPFTPIKIESEYLRELYLSVLEKSPLPISISYSNKSISKAQTDLFKEILMHPKLNMVKNYSNDSRQTAIILNSAKGRENKLFTLSGNEANCVSLVKLGYDGVLLGGACFNGHIANKILELTRLGRIEDALMLQDYMNSLLVEIAGGIELDNYLVGHKQIMVELGIFNTAKTLQDDPVSDKCVEAIRKIVKEEKDILLP
jgi:4-hydroxy-tetrahydrodipicolinate synthase